MWKINMKKRLSLKIIYINIYNMSKKVTRDERNECVNKMNV